MPQVPGIRPFDKRDLADQFRRDPAAFRHLFRSQRLAPSRGPFLGQVFERAWTLRLESRENFVPNSRHKAVLHLRDKDELVCFRKRPRATHRNRGHRDVTADDELLLQVGAELDPRA